MKQMKKTIPLLVLLAAILCGCGKGEQLPCPPKELLYLGGGPILQGFTVSGGPAEEVTPPTETAIVLFTPFDLVEEGFHAALLGTDAQGEQVDLLKDEKLSPGSYFIIEKETYEQYEDLTLFLEYIWTGVGGTTTMSRRVIDLFTQEDIVPVYPES